MNRDLTHTRPSVLLLLLLMNLLSHRTPLCYVESWRRKLPWDLLWGTEGPPSVFNDDALSWVLETLGEKGPALVGKLGERIQALVAGPTILHSDTTSFSLFGDDTGSDPDGDPAHITYGYSKVHRPDLQQILMGLTTADYGQVFLGDRMDGNTRDKAGFPTGLKTLDQEVPDTAWKHPGMSPIVQGLVPQR